MLLNRAILKLHGQVDGRTRHQVGQARDQRGLRPSCRSGCSACCRLQVTCSLADAIPILDVIVGWPTPAFQEAMTQCVADAKLLADRSMTLQRWAQRNQPCALLDRATQLCRAYDARPVICRAHVAFSDPALCAESNGSARSKTVTLDAAATATAAWDSYVKIMQAAGLPNPMAPLPYALLVGWYLLTHESSAWKAMRHTSAFNEARSGAAWLHLERDNVGRYGDAVRKVEQHLGEVPAVFPIWDHVTFDSPEVSA